ncbi:MAG: hypothetical protein AAFZ18_38945, partial [Myxococcota bacterium]
QQSERIQDGNRLALLPVGVEEDPLAEHRPAEVDCPPAAWGPEGGGFEVQTGVCNYGAFDQPLPRSLEPGEALAITVWHDFLDAAEPATGHVAIWLDDRVVWEVEVSIPAVSASLETVIPIDDRVGVDGRLGFHVRNHGFNSWRLLTVDLLPR